MEKVAVLGCGNGGKAVAAELAYNGAQVRIYEAIPNDDFRKLQQSREIKLKGAVELKATIHMVTEDLGKAVRGSTMIVVVLPSFAHEEVFKNLIPYLEEGQHVVVIPGNYATFLMRRLMKELGVTVGVTLSETVSLPYACRATSFDTVQIYKKKLRMKLATWPVAMNGEILNRMNAILEIFIPGINVLEIAMDNPNFIVHPIPTLLNVASIEKNPKGWRHYIDGISPTVSIALHEMDQERIMIGKAFGLDLSDTLSALKTFYGDNEAESIYEYVNSDQSPYKEIFGQDVFGRYVSEDLPYLAVPAQSLARIAGVKTPWIDLIIRLGSLIHHRDYQKKGYNEAHLGIDDMSLEEIKALILN